MTAQEFQEFFETKRRLIQIAPGIEKYRFFNMSPDDPKEGAYADTCNGTRVIIIKKRVEIILSKYKTIATDFVTASEIRSCYLHNDLVSTTAADITLSEALKVIERYIY